MSTFREKYVRHSEKAQSEEKLKEHQNQSQTRMLYFSDRNSKNNMPKDLMGKVDNIQEQMDNVS
jgi:hypothetical protein